MTIFGPKSELKPEKKEYLDYETIAKKYVVNRASEEVSKLYEFNFDTDDNDKLVEKVAGFKFLYEMKYLKDNAELHFGPGYPGSFIDKRKSIKIPEGKEVLVEGRSQTALIAGALDKEKTGYHFVYFFRDTIAAIVRYDVKEDKCHLIIGKDLKESYTVDELFPCGHTYMTEMIYQTLYFDKRENRLLVLNFAPTRVEGCAGIYEHSVYTININGDVEASPTPYYGENYRYLCALYTNNEHYRLNIDLADYLRFTHKSTMMQFKEDWSRNGDFYRGPGMMECDPC